MFAAPVDRYVAKIGSKGIPFAELLAYLVFFTEFGRARSASPSGCSRASPAAMVGIDAGSMPIAGLSAWAGIVSTGKLAKGQRVLIHAGAGGVGSFAVQLAKHLGATVAATAGSKNVEFVRSLGADQVIDYTKADFSTAIKDVDLVFDLIGGDVRFKSFPVLKPGGVISHISVPPMTQAPPRSDVEVKPAPVKYDTALLDQIAASGQEQGGAAHGHRGVCLQRCAEVLRACHDRTRARQGHAGHDAVMRRYFAPICSANSSSARMAKARMLARRSLLPVRKVIVRCDGPETAMQV